eukprot:TRINITY_DN76379_c0_g1_i1.p1 TRINITY_DN76379_c0_g1~~TRINITY_DN76379_c0_g1_i1.p1  ORF type:complete len:129 (+),score=31.11 TRINITY_DN76379_c0_g1_i1:72-458(+)
MAVFPFSKSRSKAASWRRRKSRPHRLSGLVSFLACLAVLVASWIRFRSEAAVQFGDRLAEVWAARSSSPPPWWILNNVTPAGPEKDMGGWRMATFSRKQQKQFGIDANGTVVNEALFEQALEKAKVAP